LIESPFFVLSKPLLIQGLVKKSINP